MKGAATGGPANIRIAADGLAAEIAPLGAELQRIADGHGRDLLWSGDPAVWAGRAPILFPIVGALGRDRYRLGGREYRLGKHGFARTSRFATVLHDAGAARFRLAADEATRAVYPFEFTLEIGFAIAGGTLSLTADVGNAGDVPLPASFGFHPAFRWPLPYGLPRGDHRLRFGDQEPAPIRRIDGDGLLRPEPVATPLLGRELLLRDELFVDDALIFNRPRSRALSYGAPGGPALRIEWENLPELGIWTKPGAGYICVEPWAGHADPEGFAGDIAEKPGIFIVAAGETRRMAMRITPIDSFD